MIEDIILIHSERGMNLLRKHLSKSFCFDAARALLALPRGEIMLTTGFCISEKYAETDGPPGTYFLSRTLEKLGFEPAVITDYPCSKLLETKKAKNPVCKISIERCGRNQNGKYLNMKGVDISKLTEPIDSHFIEPGCLTIGIGDGGNEIGMGNLEKQISESLKISPCVIKTTHLIISAVSNWGAYGLIKYLDVLTGKSTFPSFDEVKEYIEKIVALGAVDGVTGVREPSVDGFSLDIEKEILKLLDNFSDSWMGEDNII